ncbi:coiled-coil protein [Legionella beliardensis]|uniref:Coiled-coil protein n=1 Tax=Legionella beliardensis TaxID=91822 RepID=A0A378I4X2_9GAMM|nr:hypothetical protein [Legionella beliardensis]STX30063.1 coiled-coil protein [Legionella beliardensis]
MSVNLLLTTLLARLPELEWQLSKFELSFNSRVFPNGLFRCHPKDDIQAYSKEVKTDINTLSQQTNLRVAHYLALQINQKINVLVSVCQQHSKKKVTSEVADFTLDRLTTRQQWLQNLEQQITLLTQQKDALAATLAQSQNLNGESKLKLQAELGQLQKQLTLANEAYLKAMN